MHPHSEAVAYLLQRGIRSPELAEHMRIGYAPGGCLRRWLTQLGYPLQNQRQAGLVTSAGYTECVVTPSNMTFYDFSGLGLVFYYLVINGTLP